MIRLVSIVGLCLALGACGTNMGDRVATGAAIGAGVGAVASFPIGGVGALPGAALGAGIGALIPEHNLDLGKPVWR